MKAPIPLARNEVALAAVGGKIHVIGGNVEGVAGTHHDEYDPATDRWRTPRYATGRYSVPQVGAGRPRHPITLNEIEVPDGQAIIDVELKSFTEIKPDLSLELRIPTPPQPSM